MGYVALSDSNKKAIIGTIRNMKIAERTAQIGAAMPEGFTLSPNDSLLDIFWGDHLHLRGAVPEDWLSVVNTVNVKVCVHIAGDNATGSEASATVACKVQPPARLPPNEKHCSYYSRDERTRTAPADDARFEPHAKWLRQASEIEARWDKVEKQITGFLDECKSVNEAVKLYPDLLTYLPDDLKQKLGMKATKKAKDVSSALEALKNIDHELVTTSAVLARMAGAKV